MKRIRDMIGKVPKWVEYVVVCVVILAVTLVVDYVVQKYIYENVFEIVDDDFTHVFQIDSLEKADKELVLTGWVFKLEDDSLEEDFDIILHDYNNDKEYYMEVEDKVREDVNEYFLCEYDYSNSGFVASLKLNKLNFENANYEVLIRPRDVQKAYKSGIYISDGELMYTEPESFVELDVVGTDLEEIVSQGVLRVYRPDVGVYVYQYEEKLYWIADKNYEFEEDGSTLIQYHLNTTQVDKLPKHRLENKWYWDNISFGFETNEMTDVDTGKYRVTVSVIPTEYSIENISTGYYVDVYKWSQNFRPWYEFN